MHTDTSTQLHLLMNTSKPVFFEINKCKPFIFLAETNLSYPFLRLDNMYESVFIHD